MQIWNGHTDVHQRELERTETIMLKGQGCVIYAHAAREQIGKTCHFV